MERAHRISGIAVVLVGYAAIALVLTWPAAIYIGRAVPGAERTDVHNALWSIWHFQNALWAGDSVMWSTLLDHPNGGALLVADLPAALFGVVAVPSLGLPAAYSAVVIARLTLTGATMHALAREWMGESGRAAAWIAGIAYQCAPVFMSAVHNGSSETISGAPLAFSVWMALRLVRSGELRWMVGVALGLVWCALSNWYAAMLGFVVCGVFLVPVVGSRFKKRRLGALLLGVALVLPLALVTHEAATGADNLVRIKHARELNGVRRTTGVADIRGWLMPGDFRSPDFRELSRYDEQFIHCHYLGIVGVGLAIWGLRRRRPRDTRIAIAGALCLLLAMGPVLVRDGAAWIVAGDRAVPLPFFVVERLPGFSGLSLLWRLAQGVSLAVALLAARTLSGVRVRGLATLGTIALIGDLVLLSPVGRPDVATAETSAPLRMLAEAPDGAVMNFPVVGGRSYLFEQTIHGKPLAGTLNFPNNQAGRQVWRQLEMREAETEQQARARVRKRARSLGVRYLVIHADSLARPDIHDDAVRVARVLFESLAGEEGGMEIYKLW